MSYNDAVKRGMRMGVLSVMVADASKRGLIPEGMHQAAAEMIFREVGWDVPTPADLNMLEQVADEAMHRLLPKVIRKMKEDLQQKASPKPKDYSERRYDGSGYSFVQQDKLTEISKDLMKELVDCTLTEAEKTLPPGEKMSPGGKAANLHFAYIQWQHFMTKMWIDIHAQVASSGEIDFAELERLSRGFRNKK